MLRQQQFLLIATILCLVMTTHAALGQISIPSVNTALSQDFNSLASSGTSSAMPAGWAFAETGAGANATYTADNGALTTENTYSYGTTSATDRALGQLDGATVSTNIGASFTNNTGVTITTLSMQYTGEQWRLGALGRLDGFNFQYSINATALTNGTWFNIDAFDFIAPVTTGSVGALDGNVAPNRTFVANQLSGLSLANGTTFWIRWERISAVGADDGVAIDDFTLIANPVLHYTVSTAGNNLVINDIAGNSEILDVSQSGTNIRFLAAGRNYSLNGGATLPMPVDVAIAGLLSTTINAAAGNDTIELASFSTNLPDLTINGGQGDDFVMFNGDINFASNEFLNLDLQNDDVSPGIDQINVSTNTNILLSGTGTATWRVSRNMLFNTGSSLITTNGNITLEANLQSTPTTGSFIGISIVAGTIQTSGTGVLTIEGKGGTTTANMHGVNVSSGGDILGGTIGATSIIGHAGATSGSSNMGVFVTGAGSSINSGGADVSVEGFGSNSGGINFGVQVSTGGSISAGGSGSVTVEGTGGLVTTVTNDGIRVTGLNSTITSSGGNVTITGFGGGTGSASTNPGVNVGANGKITAGGSGTVTVTGTGGISNGTNNFGVQVSGANAMITSGGGAVNVTGNGGGATSTTNGYGILVSAGGTITAGSLGNVTVNGTGSMTAGNNQFGIYINGASSSITSAGGNVILTGSGGGAGTSGSCYGVNLANGIISAGGFGTVTITGTGGSGSTTNNIGFSISAAGAALTSGGGNITVIGHEGAGTSGYGIVTAAPADITTIINGGDITLKANSMLINCAITSGSGDSVRLSPLDDFSCYTGPTTDIIGGPLHLSDIELDSVFTDHLVIGSVAAGQVFVNDTMTRTSLTNVYLRSSEEVEIDGGYIHTSGGNLLLDPGTTSTGAYPDQSGTDAIAGTVSCAGKLHLVINGLVADADYEQLNITGSINLNGSELVLSGTHIPSPGQTFTIINNDGADPILNTFIGLPQGATILSFLGSPYPATISYTGGSGNDAVITVLSPDYIITTSGNNLVITDVAGNSESMSMTQNGANIRFMVSGRTFSLNGGVVSSFPADVAIAGLLSVTINAGEGDDQFGIFSFTTPLPSFTINGGIGDENLYIQGDITMAMDANVDFNFQDDDTNPGTDAITFSANVNYILSGTGSFIAKVSESVIFNNGSGIQTVHGNLVIEANQQTTSSNGSFDGIRCSGSAIIVTGSGELILKGKGGNSGSGNDGISVLSDADIVGGTTDTATIIGTGGVGGLFTSYGLNIQGAGSTISTNGANLDLYGTGGVNGNIDFGIYVASSGAISAGGTGQLSLTGVAGLDGNTSRGVNIVSSSVTTNGGNLSIFGSCENSTTGPHNYGVYINTGAIIQSGGVGTVFIEGTGGPSPANENYGVYITTGGALVTSSGGPVTVVGHGGGVGNSSNNYGVYLSVTSSISAGGNGQVSVTGNGGNTTGGSNYGVYISEANATITSSGGAVTVIGNGGTGTGSSQANGIMVNMTGKISAGGSGSVSVTGNGGTEGSLNHGVQVKGSGSAIFSDGGHLTINAFGGGNSSSSSSYGLFVHDAGMITTTNSADITINALAGPSTAGNQYGLYLEGPVSTIESVDGNINITSASNTSSIGFSPGMLMFFSNIKSTGLGDITIQSNGSTGTGNFNHGLNAHSSLIQSHDGNIDLAATGGGSINSNQNIGVFLDAGSAVKSNGIGNIVINADGGNTNGGGNSGLWMSGTSGGIYTTSGDIDIIATGHGAGTGAGNSGVTMGSGSQILAGGMGNINIQGVAGQGSGSGHYGVYVAGMPSKIATFHGDVNVIGQGGGNGGSSFNYGTVLLSGGVIGAAGNGNVTVEGTGGGTEGSDFNHGVLLYLDSSRIVSSGGDVMVTGYGGGSGTASDQNYGVSIFQECQIQVGEGGSLLIQGTGGQGIGVANLGVSMFGDDILVSGGGPVIINGIEGEGTTGYGIHFAGQSSITTDSFGGNITLAANSMITLGTIGTPDTNMVTLRPHTAGTTIHVGGNLDIVGAPLNLSDTELDFIRTGHLRIGSIQTDSICVKSDITRNDTLDITLLAGGHIVLDTGAIAMSGGNLLLDCGNSPAAIWPLTYETEVVTDTLSFGSDLLFNIAGIIPDSLYDQLQINGVIKLAGVDLKFSGSYIPSFTGTFMIVNNDGTDAIIGTFTGLPEGGTIANFLGTMQSATISYTGGDGNDVVISMIAPHYLITDAGGHLEVTDLAGNGETLTVSEMTGNIRFNVPGRNFSYNFGAITSLPADIALTGVDSITINVEGGNDIVNFNSFLQSLPGLTVNGGAGNENISFTGDITMMSDADLSLDLQDDTLEPGIDQINVTSNTNLILSGLGKVIMKVSRNITFNSGASLQTVNGDILLEANNQVVPTAENFSGISVVNAIIEITGDGQLIMNGKAGATTGSNNGIRVESGGDIIAGISGQMVLIGTGGNSNIGNAHGISLNGPGSTITSYGADVDLTGFGGGSASGDANCGVDVNLSALISAGGSGLVTINGTGGNSAGSNNNGVRVISGGTITSSGNNVTVTGLGKGTSNASSSSGVVLLLGGIITAANNGIVTVTGTGGVGTGNSNHGVFVSGAGSVIQSSGGNVFVTGSGGGTGTSTVNIGVSVASGGKISPGGMGNLEIEATGGIVDGSTNYGVNISQVGSIITSAGGNVSVLAHGGGTNASGFNYGIAVQSGTLSAGGSGNVLVEAYGGTSSGGANHGVYVRNPLSIITSSGGNVNVSGFGMGTGQANVGVVLENEGIITASDLGEVYVTGTSSTTGSLLNRGMYISGLNTKITSGGGNVTVIGQGAGAGTSSACNGLLLVGQGMITAGGTGNVSVTGTGGGGTGSTNSGISIQNANTMITSSGGNVVVTGQGGGASTSSSNYGIEMLSGSIITAGASGNVDVTGTGGLTSGSLNSGIFLTAANTRITSGGGDVTVTGQGGGSGTSGSNHGIYLFNAPKILAGGSGNVNVIGQGGISSGISNTGVYLTGTGSQITSTDGNVTVTGTGGGAMSSGSNTGVLIDATASIAAAGAGNANVTGHGGLTSGNSNYGIFVSNGNAKIGADQGDVTISGNGGGNGSSGFNFGVIIGSNGMVDANGSGNIIMSGSGGASSGASNVGLALGGPGATVQSEAGDITMTGQEGGGPTGVGFLISVGALLASDSGSIKVSANTMDIFGNIQTSSLDSTQLLPFNTSVEIELSNGANSIGGPLRLSDTKLDMISTGVLTIGDPVSDNISIGIPITRSTATDVFLMTAGDVIFDPGTINTNGGNLLLDPGPSPKAVKPITSGLEVTTDTISFGSDLAFVLNGTVVDAQYHQLNVIGVVNLSGVNLVLSGSYVPVEGDSFVLINNNDVEMIIDTFIGLSEGDTLFDFFGSMLDAVITYQGGDGNDAVLRIVQPCASPSDISISATTDTACVGTMITLELASGNLGGATDWHWYSNGCGTTPEGTGTSIMVTPSDTTTYYVRGEGGCVINEDCVSKTIVIHPFPDATIYQEFPDSCYYIDRLFRPDSPEIPGATYLWDFGPTAIPTSAIGYGPHIVYYTVPGVKNVELVIHPNADGAQCSDSSTVAFTIYNCPGQIVGDVKSDLGNPIASVNVRLYADADTNGIADNSTALRSVFTTSLGVYAMASLTPGHYVLVQTQPAGWLSLDDLDTSDDGDMVTNSDSLDNIIPVTILPREEDEDNKYVERPAPGTITGVVFQDFDLDQFPDAAEGLNAITVELFKDANTNGVADTIVPFATVTTTGNGNYSFANVPVGHYVLVEIQNPGFTSVKDFDASNDADVVPNTNMTNDTLPVTVINGETDAHNYFIDVPGCGLEVTNTLDDGPGSLRYALGCAGIGDTIHFHPTLSGLTIEITSDQLMLTTDVVVESMLNPQVILSSQIEGMFHIEAGVAVELRGVTVISGLSAGGTGAAFENHGMLTLHNTTILRNPLFTSGEYLIRNHPGAELTFSGECYIEKD